MSNKRGGLQRTYRSVQRIPETVQRTLGSLQPTLESVQQTGWSPTKLSLLAEELCSLPRSNMTVIRDITN
ncbi:MAG TPA: hypothetical protein K8V56_01630 [Sporosarcina psychrophila]|uniref:Uncharacterized protein n=1 Tax=Sporosarcina psychrophila TaxID=1476 RepID=A0A921KC40_SPOPS|nr:hypothetical protein [Sporosarcina psychrophila]